MAAILSLMTSVLQLIKDSERWRWRQWHYNAIIVRAPHRINLDASINIYCSKPIKTRYLRNKPSLWSNHILLHVSFKKKITEIMLKLITIYEAITFCFMNWIKTFNEYWHWWTKKLGRSINWPQNLTGLVLFIVSFTGLSRRRR